MRLHVLLCLLVMLGFGHRAIAKNYSDLWYAPGESGWGMQIAHAPSGIFATWYTYDEDQRQTFFTISGGRWETPEHWVDAQIHASRGSPFNAPYDRSRFVVGAPIGSAEVRFLNHGEATFSYVVGSVTRSKNLRRFPFAGSNSAVYPIDYTDIYWNPAQSGWGVSVTQRGASGFFGVMYHYDHDGKPLFFTLAADTFSVSAGATGKVFRTRSRASHFLSERFDSRDISAEEVGTFSFTPSEPGVPGASLNVTVLGHSTRVDVVRLLPRPQHTVAPSCEIGTAGLPPERWRADLNCLRDTILATHPNPAERGDLGRFLESLATLEASIATSTDQAVSAQLMRATASLRDGHTFLAPLGPTLALRFQQFPEGIVISHARAEHQHALGARVRAMGGVDIGTLRERIAAFIPRENEHTVSAREAQWLSNVSVLTSAGVHTSGTRINVVVETIQGHEAAIAVPLDDSGTLLAFAGEWSKSRRNRALNYWFEFDAARGLFYLQYNACQERPDLPMTSVAAEFRRLAQQGMVDRVILDLRYNGGGNSQVINPLGFALLEWPGSRDGNRLRMLIGKETYSSAINNALGFKQFTAVRTYGDTPGGRTDVMFTEVKTQALPYSRHLLRYSSKRSVLGQNATLEPDVPVSWDLDSYRNNADPALTQAEGL